MTVLLEVRGTPQVKQINALSVKQTEKDIIITKRTLQGEVLIQGLPRSLYRLAGTTY